LATSLSSYASHVNGPQAGADELLIKVRRCGDLSMTSGSPAMLEVTYHMVCALDTADRRRSEGALIQHYIDELAKYGLKAASLDEAMHQFGVFLDSPYCVFIINKSVFQAAAVNTAYTARISAAMVDHRTKDLIGAIQ
jgi:hypothetical protein